MPSHEENRLGEEAASTEFTTSEYDDNSNGSQQRNVMIHGPHVTQGDRDAIEDMGLVDVDDARVGEHDD